jgi:CheY-like chemotaxis protein
MLVSIHQALAARTKPVRVPLPMQGAPRISAPARSILIVEDDTIMAFAMRDELEALGYDVVGTADNGGEAIALAREFAPDLALIDVRLRGEMDGTAAARAIGAGGATRIAFVTAHVDPGTRAAMAQVGYAVLLPKPYTTAQLSRAVAAAFEA